MYLVCALFRCFFFKQKTAYEMRISDWSSDVCSSDLRENMHPADQFAAFAALVKEGRPVEDIAADFGVSPLVVQRRLKLANRSEERRVGTASVSTCRSRWSPYP